MGIGAEARRERDATVVRLRGKGWSLRRIGQDPRVRLSVQGVADVLARQDRAPRSGEELVLCWYQRGAVDGDPTAKLYWDTYKARVRQLMVVEATNLGVALDDIDAVTAEAIRRKAGAQAAAELAKVAS